MKLRSLLLSIFCALFLIPSAQAQDIHFTMWDMAPLTVNPAFTGAYSGTARIGGIYRDQWRKIGNANFSTPSVMIDSPILRGFRKNDWIGIGMMVFSDKAGSFRLGHSAVKLSGSYHFGLNKKGTSTFTLGFQGGQTQLGINFMDQNLASVIAQDELEFTGDQKVTYTDYKAGVILKSALNKKMNTTVGLSMGYLSQPEYQGLVARDSSSGIASFFDRPLLTQAHGQFEIEMNDKFTLTPQFFFQTEAGAMEISLQAYGGYKLNDTYTLRPGLGYRMTGNDAIEVLMGIDYKDNIRVTAAYDANISELVSVTNGVGAFEIAAWYIIKIFKKPDVKPAILCPRL